MKIEQLVAINKPATNTEAVLTYLQQLIGEFQKNTAGAAPDNGYAAYLHGQIYGIALTMQMLYPGPGNWGEKAAFLVRPVLTEDQCDCSENTTDLSLNT